MSLDQPLLIVYVMSHSWRARRSSSTVRNVHTQRGCSLSVRMNCSATPFSFRCPDKGRTCRDPEEPKFGLEVVAHILTPMIMAHLQARRAAGHERPELPTDVLAERFQGFKAGADLRRVESHCFQHTMIDGDEHRHGAVVDGPGTGRMVPHI